MYKSVDVLKSEKRELNNKYIKFSIMLLLVSGGIYLYIKQK